MVNQGFVYSFKMFGLLDRNDVINAPAAPLEKLEKISKEFEMKWKRTKLKEKKNA